MPAGDPPLDFTPLLRDLTSAATRLRAALRPAIAAVLPPDADFTSRQVAEAIGLDKTLGWRCLRIATIADEAAILGSLPREKGWRKILDGLAAAGCPDDLHRDLSKAVAELTSRLQDKGLSREALSVITAGELDDDAQHEALRRLRRQYFENGRLIWGVSARIDLSSMLVAPREDGASANLAGVNLIDGLTRHRDGPPWNMYVGLRPAAHKHVDVVDLEHATLLADLSTTDHGAGEVTVSATPEGRWRYDFIGPRRGRDGTGLRMAFLETISNIGPLQAEPGEETVAQAVPYGVPKAHAFVDLLLHKSIRPSAMPYAAVYATLNRNERTRLQWPETTRLPLDSQTEEVDSPRLPEEYAAIDATWSTLLERGARTLGCDLDDFRIHRTSIAHPPIPSTAVIRWGLPIGE